MSDSEDIPDEGDHVPDVDNDEASDDEESGDVDDDDRMEAITQDTLKGRWMHSGGDRLNVVNGVATFDSGGSFPLTAKGTTVEIDGWTASLAKSVADRIVWMKASEDKPSHWTFESDIIDGEDGAVEIDTEQIDTSNIIEGKRRRRGGVDYAKLDAEMTKAEAQAKALADMRKRQQGGVVDEYAGTDEDIDQPPAPKKRKVASLIPELPAISIEELKKINSELRAATKSPAGIESIKGDKVMDSVAKLASFPMTLAVLTETKVGKQVNSFRKHSNSKAGDSAKELVGRWKKLM